MKINFINILFVGLIGLSTVIYADIFQDMLLKVVGLIVLAIVFVVNSKMLLNRIEKLENGH